MNISDSPRNKIYLLALVLLLGLLVSQPLPARATGNFIVNSPDDTALMNAVLTLREAIQVANGALTGPFSAAEQAQLGGCTFDGSGMITGGCGAGVFDNITFDSSVTQVNLTSALPHLTDAGTWINGNAGAPRIDAGGITTLDVFVIDGNDITISNLSIVNGYPSGLGADIAMLGGKDARIAYNYLGSVPSATDCAPSGVTRNSAVGIYIDSLTSGSSGVNNGAAYIYGNTIGCHGQYGIYVFGADYVYIGEQPDGTGGPGNYIGMNNAASNLGNGSDGVNLTAASSNGAQWNVVKYNQIRNNLGHGIHLAGTGFNSAGSTTYNWIQGNIINMNTLSGIRLTSGAYTNFIGGGSSGDGNWIAWSGEEGISILNSNNNLLQGNSIGYSGKAGVYLNNAGGNTLADNMISANGWAGVWAFNSSGNTIKGNKIGTNSGGTAALANGHDGVALTDGSHDNTIGGTTLADRNIISGNALCGVHLRDGASNNTINYNLIGLNAAGAGAIPNGLAGVCVFSGSNDNTIGASAAGASQYISGNTREGIYIENSDGNTIGSVNRIGVATDDATARGNGWQGVMLNGAASSIVLPHLVAYNGGAGIAVVGATAAKNDIKPAQVRNNGGLPIDLGNDGHTPNGSQTPPGPNDWLNYPVITDGSGNDIKGTTCANCTVRIYRAIGNPAAPGGGGAYLQSATANGLGDWSATLPAGTVGSDVAVQAQDSISNTSEMSPRPLRAVYLPLVLR